MPDSVMELVFPTAAMIREWSGVLHYLVGVVCGGNLHWPRNWILSNGARTQLPDKFDWEGIKKFDFMMENEAHRKIRTVRI